MSETPLVDEQEGKDHCNERECSEKDAASHVLVDMTLRVLATPHFIVMVSSSGLFSVSSSELFSMSSVITTPLAFKVASSVHLVSSSHVYSWTRGTKLRSVHHILKAHLLREVNVLNLLLLIKYDVNFIF